MSEEQKSSTFEDASTFIQAQTSENDSISSDGLEIDISESPRCKKEIDIEDKRVLENIEEEIERQYDEKAAKSNLTAVNVKNILKHVITNEHVWAMVRNTTEENIPDVEHAVYEPKLTRAKAKELLKNQNVPAAAIPWASPAPKSEVHILINGELPEDSDDDEYVPHEEESEDEKESGHPSDIDSQPATPATPTSTHDSSTQTMWTEDGVFKVPQSTAIPKTPTHETNENIALRTRSKLSLSDTPLEIIEEAFIPPDITTDMYDLECDDEDWKDFLKKFTRPLDEAVTGTQEDDDEADPEYNVLSDEEIDKLDKKEELRQDKGVKVTKKELSTLVAELFEFSEMFSNAREQETDPQNNQVNNTQSNVQSTANFTEAPTDNTSQISQISTVNFTLQSDNYQPQIIQEQNNIVTNPAVITAGQMMLFEQQMRQHVQMLTQNYILTYKNVYFNHLADKFKNMILSLHELAKYKTATAFKAYNLKLCVDFIKDWDEMIASNTEEVQEMLEYVEKVANNYRYFIERKQEYIVTFPRLLMKKVSESPAFMYPSLLPRIPFKYKVKKSKHSYVKSEIELVAIGLEQFRTFLKGNRLFKTRNGLLSNNDVCHYICTYMMPHRDPKKLFWYIQRMRYLKQPNAIKYYFVNNKAPVAMHYVCSLEQFGALPPRSRSPDTLPYQWKNYIYPEPEKATEPPPPIPRPRRVTKPPAYKKQPKKKKIKISSSDTDPLSTENLGNSPIVIINNYVSNNLKCEVKNPPLVIIQNTIKNQEPLSQNVKVNSPQKQGEETQTIKLKFPESRNRFILPKLEQVFLKCSDFGTSISKNTIKYRNTAQTADKEPPLVSTTKQIKKLTPEILKIKFNSTIFKKVKDLDMLPSMPFLQTPVKEPRNLDLNDLEAEPEQDPLSLEISTEESSKITEETSKTTEETSKTTEDYSKSTGEENETITENNEPEKDTKKDDEDELNALMVASSTMQQKNRRLQPNLTKKAKQMREYNATLAMLCPENQNKTEEKAKNFAQAYYDKVQERLESESPLEYQKFMEALSDHDETTSTVSDLYEKVSSVLSPNHPDLCEEFLSFLTPEQAQQIGKLVPHFMLSNMSLFLRKLEIYYSNQPAQLRKIYNSLTELTDTPDVTMDKVKSTILPLLKGNALLIDWFLQMFPEEPPRESMITNWEQLNCDEEDKDEDDKIFETLNLPEVEDPYGGPNCICKCHKIDDEMYKSRARHCIPCGTKFLQGRVYVQTGKGLRLANVTFNSSLNSDHIKRISVKPIIRPKRKSETSPSKILMSPTKDDEPRHSNESEDDINSENIHKKIKTLKSFRTSSPSKTRKKPTQRTPKTVKKEAVIKNKTKPEIAAKKVAKQTKTQQKKTEETTKPETKEPETSKQEINESETEELESMDTCEESSQDTLEESDDSMEEIESENSEDSYSPLETEVSETTLTWTREEDKVILQTLQKCGYSDKVFKDIRKLLPGRTETEIKQRFRVLMSLLKEMTSDNS